MSKAKVGGRGSIVPLEDKPRSKCRKWQLRVSTGLDPATGKYSTRTRRFPSRSDRDEGIEGTYTQAEAALRNFAVEVESNEAIKRRSATMEAAAMEFLEARRGELTEDALSTYAWQLKCANLHLGAAKVRQVTTLMVERMRSALLRGETLSGRKMAASSVAGVQRALSVFFRWAVLRGLSDGNPCEGLAALKARSPEKKALKRERLNAFVASLDPADAKEIALLLYATMGLRRGEALNLVWDRDVDFKARTLEIRSAKTEAGDRILPMPDIVFDALRKRRTAQREQFDAARVEIGCRSKIPVQDCSTRVCTDNLGRPINPKDMSQWWGNHAKDYGLEGYTLHELRHSYLTALARAGVHPKVMQELAGHASFDVTMEVYTHVHMDDKREAVIAFEESM